MSNTARDAPVSLDGELAVAALGLNCWPIKRDALHPKQNRRAGGQVLSSPGELYLLPDENATNRHITTLVVFN